MKALFKPVFLGIFFLIALSFTACSVKEQKTVDVNNIPNYSEVMALESKDNHSKIFKIEDNALKSIDSKETTEDMVYSMKNSVYIHSVKVSEGKNIYNNIIDINVLGKRNQLKDFYSAVDLKLNNNATKLAFRTFKNDSLESAEGMRIYDIKNNKYLQLKSQVLISGNLYEWIDENKIIYYGSMLGKKNSNKIYMYDFKLDREEIYVDNINGYCIYFTPIKNNVLILGRQGNKEELYYYNRDSKTAKTISNNIVEINKSITNYKSEETFFFGSQDEKMWALYSFSHKDFTLKRITYDFPSRLSIFSGISMDKNGNVYFCGIENSEEEKKKDIFSYSIKDNSVNIISTQQGNYSVYSDVESY